MNTYTRNRLAGWIPALLAILIIIPAVCMADNTMQLPPGDRPPPDVFSRVADAGTALDHDGADYIVVYDYASNRMKPSGVTYVESYLIYKVLTAAGCRDRSVLRWNYDPRSSYVEVREVNIIRNGERMPVDVSRLHDLPAPQSMIYWNDRIKTLQLPHLLPNDGIEVKIFRKGFTYALLSDAGSAASSAAGARGDRNASADAAGGPPDDSRYVPPMPGEYFDIVLFGESVPVIEKKYVLQLPPGKLLHSEIYNGPLYASTAYAGDSTEYAWWGLNLPAWPHEPSQPAQSDYVPKVVMATVESWEAKSRWFFDVNRNQFAVTPAITEKVDDILEHAGVARQSEERKARVLVHWVAQNIRYSGQTMGAGEGFTLHPGSMIFEQRSGVCKDIAGMLITMMRAAGMKSFAAMTMAGSRIEGVPADQFNHCVCALRTAGGRFEMYDPTWVPYNNNIWSLLEAEQDYLIGTPEGEPLSRIAYSPPEESPLAIRDEARLLDDGTLEGTLELSGSGALDSRLRRMLTSSRRQDLDYTIAALLAPVSDRVEHISYEFIRLDDFSRDMRITIHYRIPRFARRVGNGFEFTSPMMSVVLHNMYLFRAAAPKWADERTADVFLYYTEQIDGTERILLPRGFSAVELPSSREIDETYASFKGTSRMDGGSLLITQRAQIRRRQIPPGGGYDGFRRAIDEAKEWGGVWYRVEKGGRP